MSGLGAVAGEKPATGALDTSLEGGAAPLGHDPPYWTSGSVDIDWVYHDSSPPIKPAALDRLKLQYRYRDSSNMSSAPWTDYQTKAVVCPFVPPGPGSADCTGRFTFTFGQAGRAEFQFVPLDLSNNVLAPPPDFHPSSAGNDSIDPIASISQTGSYWKTSRTVSVTHSAVDGVAIGRAEVRRYYRASNASGWSAPATVRSAPPDPFSDTFSNTVPSDGFYRFEVHAWDQAGNTASNLMGMGVDSTAPTPSLSLTGAYWRGGVATSLPFSATDPGAGDLSHGVSQIRLYSATRPDNATGWTSWSQIATSSSSSGTFNVNVAVNQHTKFGIIARDTLGNEHPAVADMGIGTSYDSAAPGGSVNTAPFWKSNRSFAISYAAGDNMASDGSLRNITLWEQPRAGNSTCGARTLVVASASVFSGPASRTVGADGYYCYTMYVNDKAGNGGIVQGFVGVDTGSPAALANSSGAYWVAETRTIHYQGSDSMAMDHASLEQSWSQDNVSFSVWSEINRAYSPFAKDYSWIPSSDGFFRFRAVSYDRAGNSAPSAAVALGNDSAPPSASLMTASYWGGAGVNLSLNASDSLQLKSYVLYAKYSADNVSWGAESAVASRNLTGTAASTVLGYAAPKEGHYRFRAEVSDHSGRIGAAVAGAGVDTAAPAAAVALANCYWVDGDAELDYGVSDAGEVSELRLWERYSSDNSTWGQWSLLLHRAIPPFNGTHNRTSMPEGFYQWGATALDRAGHLSALGTQAAAGVDRSPPGVNASGRRYWERASVNVSVSASDSAALGRLVVDYEFSADNSTWSNATRILDQKLGGKQVSLEVPVPSQKDGHYILTATVEDKRGRTATDSVQLGLDSSPPRTSLSGLGNHTSSSSFGIAATADDALSGLAHLELWYRKDGGSWIRHAQFLNTSVFFDSSTAGGDGRYEFRSVGVDNAGNLEAKTSADIATTVDTRAPRIASHLPGANEDNVPVNPVIEVKFDEVVRPEGVLELRDSTGPIPATVGWEADGRSVSLTPKGLLSPLASHVVSVDGIEDLAGNAMTFHTWDFTTGDIPPNVVTTDPLNGSSVPVGRVEVRVSFSKAMDPATAGAVSTNRGKVLSSDLAGASLRVVLEFTSPGEAQVSIDSSVAKDATGMFLDGNGDGGPGGDFVLTLNVMPGKGSLRAVVRSASGAPIEGATVSVELNGSLVAANRTDAGGVAEIRGLAPGTYRVTASKAGHLSSSASVVVEAGKESAVELRLVSESDVLARFPGGALGLGSVAVLGILLALAALLLLRRRKRPRRETPASAKAEDLDQGEGVRGDKSLDTEAPASPRTEKAMRSAETRPPPPPLKATDDWREVEREVAVESPPSDVELESRVVHPGASGARADFGCPVCGHLVRGEEDECPGCGAEVKW